MKLLDQAQRGAKKLILRAINWTLTEGLESEVNIGPIDLKLDKFAANGSNKTPLKRLWIYQNKYNKNNIWETSSCTNGLNIIF